MDALQRAMKLAGSQAALAEEALQEAIDLAGSQAALANMIEVVPMAVTNWKRRGVPVAQAIAIEKALGVPRERLRPDVFAKPVERSRKPRKKAA